jgi:hypothetical protein
MIIFWFTQPKNSFASYFQYDTVTQQFSRIRLELGRISNSGRITDTFVSCNSQRTVGFSKDRHPFDRESPGYHWTVKDGALCYDGKPLPGGRPSIGDRVYDTSDPKSFVHAGNLVTDTPKLPPDIEPRHLALLANDALVSKTKTTLTPGDASEGELVNAIKGQVCRILGVKDVASITDEMILDKLTSQAGSIRRKAVSESVSSMEKALTAAKDASALVSEQIQEGLLTPIQEFEDAFGSLQSALTSAETASSDADVQQSLTEIGKAQQAVNTAIEDVDAAKNEAAARQLDSARELLSQAERHATDWQAVETEYKPLAEASTVEDYMDTMSGGKDA